MYWSMKMLLSILVAVILLEGVAAFVSLSRRPSFCLSPVKVASFDLTPRIKPSSVKIVTQIDLLYDSECPLCAMEVEFLKKRDYENKIRFTDLSSLDYNPSDHGDVKFSDGMRKIRAILPDTNEVVTGVEVFRHVYRAIGLGWMFDVTSLPIIGNMADALYDLWAENRLRLTGRGDLADILAERAEKLREAEPLDECDLDACNLDFGELE